MDGCGLAHFLKNVMKHAISKCRNDAVLTTVVNDLRSVRKIVEDANRSKWNYLLSDDDIQESKTRFETHYQVVDRFLKSANKLVIHLGTRNGCATGAAYTSFRKTSNIDGTIIEYPALEAIYDAVGVITDCM